jgi:hypothetical protein
MKPPRPLAALLLASAAFAAGLLLRPTLAGWAKVRFPSLTSSFRTIEIPRPGAVLSAREAAPSPIARYEPAAVQTRGKVYVFGGFTTQDLHATTHAAAFDPATGAWAALPGLPAAVTHAGIAATPDAIWIAGGFTGNHPGQATSAVWRFDLASRTWSPGPLLPEPRAAGALVYHAGRLHYFGGLLPDRQTDSPDHWALTLDSPSAGWSRRAPLLPARNHFAAAVFDGRIHAIGGQQGHDVGFQDVALHHVYDPSSDSWSEAAPLPLPVSHNEPGTFVHGEWILSLGGRSNGIPILHDILAYHPATNRWRRPAGLPTPMRSPVAAIFGNRLYVGLAGVTATGVYPTDRWFTFPLAELESSLAGAAD